MPSSSTNYSYNIPTVGSDSTTYGTLINAFVNSLSTKLKAVSDAINTAGVGAASTLAQINRNIAQVDALNSRLPAGVADLLPDPYSGATTPVSTWPYLNTELTAEGFSPPTTAQEVLDFDYTGFASYLNTRFDSLSARIVGLDAPITIADSSTLVCETNAILDTIGEYKTVTTSTTTNNQTATTFFDVPVVQIFNQRSFDPFYGSSLVVGAERRLFNSFISAWSGEGLSSTSGQKLYLAGGRLTSFFSATVRARNVSELIAAGVNLNPGVYLELDYTYGSPAIQLNKDIQIEAAFPPIPGLIDGWTIDLGVNTFRYAGSDWLNSLSDWGGSGSPVSLTLRFVKVTGTVTTTETSTLVKKTIADVDFSGCT